MYKLQSSGVKNYRKPIQGDIVWKYSVPALLMERVLDIDLWIWSFQFGLPRVLNDSNVQEVSNL